MPGRVAASVGEALSAALGTRIDDKTRRPVGGGSINSAFEYRAAQGSIFVKVSAAPNALDMFQAEAAGLKALAAAQAVRVPNVLALGQSREGAYLALEWIALSAPSRSTEAMLGEQLAWQHRCTHAQFGWERDNTIGSTPQRNAPTGSWDVFYRDQRLRPQLDLAAERGASRRVLDRGYLLCEKLPQFFSDYRPVASLLHGDLWGGNWASDDDGLPVIFDPAVYYGDRETDIAMTRLFGGFGPAFYAAYHSTWPLDAGASTRVPLYNLYHVLNHYNLFGGGYLRQAESMIDALLAAVGH
jgi:protein-ribulosamine 3-kinase